MSSVVRIKDRRNPILPSFLHFLVAIVHEYIAVSCDNVPFVLGLGIEVISALLLDHLELDRIAILLATCDFFGDLGLLKLQHIFQRVNQRK